MATQQCVLFIITDLHMTLSILWNIKKRYENATLSFYILMSYICEAQYYKHT